MQRPQQVAQAVVNAMPEYPEPQEIPDIQNTQQSTLS